MTSYALSNALLPAVCISSVVFSAMTLPFALIKKEPVVVELPFFSGEIQPIFNGDHKEVAIPYVGFAIVVSVGAGIASVEVNRRWKASRASAQNLDQVPTIQPNSLNNEALPEAIKLAEYRPEASAIKLSSKDEVFKSQSLIAPDALSGTQLIPVENPVDLAQLSLPQTSTQAQTNGSTEKLNLSPNSHGNNSVDLESSMVKFAASLQDLDLACSNILESPEQYQICRIKVPSLEGRLFAILFQGEYYSFFRSEKTKEKIREILAKVKDRVGKTVITKTQKGYVIWTWEAEALCQN